MPKKQLIIGPLLASLVLVATASAQSPTNGQTGTSSRRVHEATPVIQRGARQPTSWGRSGKTPRALTKEQAQSARQAAHFDTTGKAKRSSGISNRLRQIRRSVVFDDIQPVKKQPSSRRPTGTSRISSQSAPSAEAAKGSQENNSKDVPAPIATDADSDVEAASPSDAHVTEAPVDPARASGGYEELPSVMKAPTARQDMSHGASARVADATPPKPIEPQPQDTTAPADNLNAVPMANDPVVKKGSATSGADRVLTSNRSPVLSVTTRGPRTIVVGKAATFLVEVENTSQVSAKDVVVRMDIPHWVEVVGQTATLGSARVEPDAQGDSTLMWTLRNVDGGTNEKLSLELIPRGSRPLDLGVNWTFNPNQATAQIQVQEPKLELTVIGPQDVLFGETKVYTITVSNPGTGDAENVVLNLMPLVPSERTAGVRQLGTIRAGTRRTLEVELTARQTGRLQVRAEATADGSLRSQGVQDVFVRRAALEVQVDGPPMKYAGTRARYSIRVTNTGDATAQEAVAVATLPAGAKNVNASSGGSLDTNHGQIHWQLGSIRPNATRIVEMECTLISPGSNRLDLRTVAHGDVSALGSAVTNVESLADLKMTVNDPKGAAAVGSDVGYEIRIENRGTKAAGDIQLYGYFSDGIEPTTIRGWRGSVNEGEVVMERIPRLGAGQQMVIKINAQAHQPGDHVFRAELECVDPETKLAVEEWTRFFGDATAPRQADRRESVPPTTPGVQQQR